MNMFSKILSLSARKRPLTAYRLRQHKTGSVHQFRLILPIAAEFTR